MYNLCQLGQLVPPAQLARSVLFMPIGPIGSTGPIVAVCPNELMPIGPIGSIGQIGAICPNEMMPIGLIGSTDAIGAMCTISANRANWFNGPNWCGMSQ
jgi:hypothetical protein